MRSSTSLFFCLALFVSVSVPVVAVAQDEEAPAEEAVPPDELASEFIKEAKKVAGKQEEADELKTITKLVQYCQMPGVEEKTREDASAVLEKFAKDDRQKVALEGLKGLGASRAGSKAAKRIFSRLGRLLKAKEPDKLLVGAAFAALGALADESKGTVNEIVKLMRDNDPETAANAIRVAASYGNAELEVRKELFEAVLKQTEGPANAAQSDPNSSAARRWNQMASATKQAFKSLSRQSFADPAEARSWFNDHKKDKEAWE